MIIENLILFMDKELKSAALLVRDLMKIGVATCSPDTPASEIAKLLVDKKLEAVVVLDPVDGHGLGIVSQDDLVKSFSLPGARIQLAEAIMQDEIPQVPADIPVTAAAQLMVDQGLRVLFLMHHSGGIEYPAAMLTYEHILRFLAAKDQEDLKDLGMKADRQSPVEAFLERRDAARERNKHKQ